MSAVPYSDLLGAWDPIAVLADTPVHPEFGEISVDWVIRVLAGHDLHHLQHLRAIAER